MKGTQQQGVPPTESETTLRLVCTEIWGGNRPISAPIELPGVRGRIFSRPSAGGRGGDIHYLSACSSGLISRMCLADVVGHGEAVATVSGHIHDLLRRYMNWLDERVVLAKLNRRLTKMGFDALTTAAAITYFPPWRRLSVSYAGHPPAWLYRREADRWTPLEPDPGRGREAHLRDLPLAVDAATRFTREILKVARGDRLLALTDGVLEAPDANTRHFGSERLAQLLHEHRHATPAGLTAAVIDGVVTYTGDVHLSHDDVTLLLIEFVSPPPGSALWRAIKNRITRPHGNSATGVFAAPAGT